MSEPNPVIPIIRTRILEKVILKTLNLRNGLEIKSVTVVQLKDPDDFRYQMMKRHFTETPKVRVFCNLPWNEKREIMIQIRKLTFYLIVSSIGRISRKKEFFFLVYLDF